MMIKMDAAHHTRFTLFRPLHICQDEGLKRLRMKNVGGFKGNATLKTNGPCLINICFTFKIAILKMLQTALFLQISIN